MAFPLYVTCCFSFVAFNILSLCLVFVSLISMCLGVFLLGFTLYGTVALLSHGMEFCFVLFCFLKIYLFFIEG